MICLAAQKSHILNVGNFRFYVNKSPTSKSKRIHLGRDFSELNSSLSTRRRRTRTKMAVEPTMKANVGAAIMLTSGASGRVNALLWLRALKSLAMLINAFVLLLLLPFRGRKRCMTTSPSMMSSSSSSGCSEKGHNKEEKLRDKKGKTVARVPARIVPWKSSSAVVVDQEVADALIEQNGKMKNYLSSQHK